MASETPRGQQFSSERPLAPSPCTLLSHPEAPMSYLVTAAPEPDKVSGEKWFRWTGADGRGHPGQRGLRELSEKSQAMVVLMCPTLPCTWGKPAAWLRRAVWGLAAAGTGHPAQAS